MDIGSQLDVLAATRGIPAAGIPGHGAAAPASPRHVSDAAFLDALARQLGTARSAQRTTADAAAEIRAQLSQIDISQLREIDGAARQLEGLLLENLLKQMWATLPHTSLLGNGLEAQFYREMWLEKLAGQIAVDGPGLGIAAALTNEMVSRYMPPPQDEKMDPLTA